MDDIGKSDCVQFVWCPFVLGGVSLLCVILAVPYLRKCFLRLKSRSRYEPCDETTFLGENALQEERNKRNTLAMQLEQCRTELLRVTKEKEDFQNRLSEAISSKLRANNPNIADLNDMNRPSKLGERCSELYDNQWTNAFDDIDNSMEQKEGKETTIIMFLLDILKITFKFCDVKTKWILNSVKEDVRKVTEKLDCMDTDLCDDMYNKAIMQRKMVAARNVPDLVQVKSEIKRQMNENFGRFLDIKSVEEYIKKCTYLCWLMVAQDPPMEFVFAADDNPKNYFRSFTRDGSRLEFIVWPALLLQKGGAIVYKGVAQFFD